MIYTFYDVSTGVIQRVMNVKPERLQDYMLDGEAAYEGEIDTTLFDKVVDGQPAATERTFNAMAYARFVRNMALQESDWTQSADAPFDAAQKNELRRWRQDLRDFPDVAANCTSEEEVQELMPIKPRV